MHSVKPHLIISICNKCRHDHHSLIYATYAVANREPETGLTGFDIGAALWPIELTSQLGGGHLIGA